MRSWWLGLGCLVLGATCSRTPNAATAESGAAVAAPAASSVAVAGRSSRDESTPHERAVRLARFRDVHAEAGIQHVYVNGERGRCLLFETTGGGAGWLDYDADGHWDLYLNQGGDATAGSNDNQPTDRLFRNRGDGTFDDVTEQARLRECRYSQGVAVADFDNDGFDDVYVTNLGGNTLFHNLGDGTFVEVTDQAQVRDGRWSASAAWADLDLDGNLDLYVTNYCVDDPMRPAECKSRKGRPSICHPRNMSPWPDEVYINRGDGTFSAEFQSRGFTDPDGRGLGVAIADFNNDGLPDVFVSNDTTANYLFVNQGNGQFKDMALLLGCATDAHGSTMANMGIAVYDFDGNGWLDVYVTHFRDESDSLYRNYGDGGFQDEGALWGIRAPTIERLSFGAVMADFNQDGLAEIVLACGHIENAPEYPFYRMPPLYFAFDGRRWHEVGKDIGAYFHEKYVGRAIAACDFDADGDLDLAVVHENSPAALLRNESERGHWMKLLFRGRRSNRRGIGCRITVEAGPVKYVQELCGGTSYAATHQPALVVGLGRWESPCTVTVRWPSGLVETRHEVRPDQTLVLDESQAAP